ncbi:MAG: hydroxyacid dehydrogenase [Halobacteriovoraceae bacterium]|nr:hydroxyacid dehydrogenase [Halobacteriovoraceae bacterium]|tara:strand:- start:195070 stop:196125 length:1056 start_codon:yes stop_codon:yes gene_type:complete
MNTIGYAAFDKESPLKPFSFNRRELRANDVAIDIKYCGVCHSDLHQAKNDWHGSNYPLVPGHEIVGVVTNVGPKVNKYKEGDLVAVGCMVDSCQNCSPCKSNEEQFCEEGSTQTYNSKDRVDGEITYGGYSDNIVVREEFVLRVPEKMELSKVAPILCAGVTTYSPLKEWGVEKGDRVGVVGLGGLGHMAVKLAAAMGAEVTLFTTSKDKALEAKKLGANHVVISKDEQQMQKAANSLDVIIDTVPVAHDLSPYIQTLDIDGTLIIVGAIDNIPSFHSGLLLGGRKRVAASVIGGIEATQEVLDFCAKHDIYPDCEMIDMQEINTAFERMKKGDVKYRFVINMESIDKDKE